MLQPFAKEPGTILFAVYDGHGPHGHNVSQEVMHSIYYELEETKEELLANPAKAITDAFAETNQHLFTMSCEENLQVDASSSGACALVAFMHGPELVVAGAGDCRAIIGRRDECGNLVALPMSRDHQVDVPEEKSRIEAAGGYVRPEAVDEEGEVIPSRLYTHRGGNQPGLRISRVLGDLAVRHLVTCEPEVLQHTVDSTDEFLVMASDGVCVLVEQAV